MKKSQVTTGKVYEAKVSSRIVPVRLVTESAFGGWNAINVMTGRPVRIKTAGRLRKEIAS